MTVHGRLAIIVTFSLCTLSSVIVGLRFYARHFLVGKLSAPDWVMLVAVISTWGSAVVNRLQLHYMDYPPQFSMEFFARNVRGGLLTFWIYRIIYLVDLCLIKVSILLFYNHFASAHKTFHRIVRGIMVIVILATLAMVIASIMSCNPPSDAWSTRVFIHGGMGIKDFHCYDPRVLWYFSAGFNLLTDFIIWVLPLPFFLKLQSMPLRRRLGLVGIFSIGIIATIASAIRLWIMTLWATDFHAQGRETGNFLIWGQVEQHAGIISASIPFLRPIARKLFASAQKRHQPSPGPVRKLLPNQKPSPGAIAFDAQRTPIIPSPSPTQTANSGHSPYRMPPSPLSPFSPAPPFRQSESIGHVV